MPSALCCACDRSENLALLSRVWSRSSTSNSLPERAPARAPRAWRGRARRWRARDPRGCIAWTSSPARTPPSPSPSPAARRNERRCPSGTRDGAGTSRRPPRNRSPWTDARAGGRVGVSPPSAPWVAAAPRPPRSRTDAPPPCASRRGAATQSRHRRPRVEAGPPRRARRESRRPSQPRAPRRSHHRRRLRRRSSRPRCAGGATTR